MKDKKFLKGTLIVIVAFFVLCNVAFASFGSVFGGRIIENKATEIRTLEESGYNCTVPGETIQIRSIKGPVAYLIRYGTRAKTNTTPSINQTIIGKYSNQESITCTKTNPDGSTSTTNVLIDVITIAILFVAFY